MKKLVSLLLILTLSAMMPGTAVAPTASENNPVVQWNGRVPLQAGGTYAVSGRVRVGGAHEIPEGAALRVLRGGELIFERSARVSVRGELRIAEGGRIFNSGVVTLEEGAVFERITPAANSFVNTRNGRLQNNSGGFDRWLFTAQAISREPLVFKRGIDVSRWQGDIDWASVANAGVDFAMLRIGRGAFTDRNGNEFTDDFDSRFHEYIEEAIANNIEVGVYWYSYARTVEQIRREARFLVRILGEVTQQWEISYPVVLDMEESRDYYLDCPSEMAEAFLEIIAAAGYFPMIYSFRSWLDMNLTDAVKDRYAVWVAHWDVPQTNYSRNFYMWQYTESGRVSGISGGVDLNIGYRDFAAFIRRHGLNGQGNA